MSKEPIVPHGRLSIPRRHHYLPRFYLERFTRDGELWVFDRVTKEFRLQTPINTAVERDFYAASPMGQIEGTEVEALLSLLEGEAGPALERLDRRASLSFEDRVNVAYFAAFLRTRTPEFADGANRLTDALVKQMARRDFASPARARAVLRKIASTSGSMDVSSVHELCTAMREGRFGITLSKNHRLLLTLQMASEVAQRFMQMGWVVVHAPRRKSFVTCDAPMAVVTGKASGGYETGGVGIATPEAVSLVPLGAQLCLLLCNRDADLVHNTCTGRILRSINLAVTENCYRFVIAPDERLLTSLVKAAGVHD